MSVAPTLYIPSDDPATLDSNGTILTVGAIADGQYLKRSGATVVGGAVELVLTAASDPRSGSGLAAGVGTFAKDGSNILYQKVTTSDTGWNRLTPYTHTVTGAAVTSFSISGIDGNLDGSYALDVFIVSASSGGNFGVYARPNGLSTNQTSSYGALSTMLAMGLCGVTGVTARALYRYKLISRSGRVRLMEGTFVRVESGVYNQAFDIWSVWNDTSTNLTSLTIEANVAGAIGIGSCATLTPLGNPLL